MPRREDHEVHKDMWDIGGKKKNPFVQKFDESVIVSGQTCYKERPENDVILFILN